MPTSDFSLIPSVTDVVRNLRPKSICDIGVGCGKYGLLFREALDLNGDLGTNPNGSLFLGRLRLDGVEAYPGYLGPIQEAIYDNIFIGDVRALAEELGEYDLFAMIDIVEHMDIESATRVIQILRRKSRIGVLVVTPIRPAEQGATMGNEYEAHVSAWGRKQWTSLGRTRYTIVRHKWLALVEGTESGLATWLRIPRLRRRCKFALLKALGAIFLGRKAPPDF